MMFRYNQLRDSSWDVCALSVSGMENSEGVQSLCTERRQAAFRKLITTISEHLLPNEVQKCAFMRQVPRERSATALETLEYLLQNGAFSHSNVEPLVDLLRDIKRHDLNELIESFLQEYSPPNVGVTQRFPQTEPSATSIPPSLAMQETTDAAQPHATSPSYHQPSISQQPFQESISCRQTLQVSKCLEMSSDLPHLTSPTEVSGPAEDSQDFEPQVPLFEQATMKQPANFHSSSHLEHSRGATAAASTDQLGQFTGSLSQILSSTPPTEVSTVPRQQSYYSNAPHSSTGYMSLPTHFPPARSSLSTGKLSCATTPGTYPGPIFPNIQHRSGSLPEASINSLTQALGHSGRNLSRTQIASGNQRGDESPRAKFLPRSSSFELTHPAESEGANSAPLHAAAATEGDSPAYFRQRLGSRRRFLTKFPWSRDRTSSMITWSVKRSKLNKVIYEHQKEKLFKFPRQLELENGGKHPPKITLYLHPYGFEKDARHNLTLTITLDISVKCHIPTSATIVVEVEASDSSTGAKLKRDSIKCPANCRFARCMSFLSHKQLKDLECESIEFTAAAKLFTTGLND